MHEPDGEAVTVNVPTGGAVAAGDAELGVTAVHETVTEFTPAVAVTPVTVVAGAAVRS